MAIEDEMSLDQASFRSRVVEKAYRYWSSKRKSGRLPSRADMRPEDMPLLLPHVFLVDVSQEPLEFRFRLIGTSITSLAGREYTGLRVNRQEYGPDWKAVFEAYWHVACTGIPELGVRRAPWPAREFLFYERLIAPLSSDGSTVDMLFGAIDQIVDP